MKKFKVYGRLTIDVYKEIEAEDEYDAWDDARDLEAKDFDFDEERDCACDDLDITDVSEVKDDDEQS